MPTPSQDPAAEHTPEEAEFLAWVASWDGQEQPALLSFLARYTRLNARMRARRGEPDESIREDLMSRSVRASADLHPGARRLFLQTIRDRIDEALAPTPERTRASQAPEDSPSTQDPLAAAQAEISGP
ncbi:hypothetical protein [Singulisphaera sp. PoT]|uniref:hypothetical protein n=1 Tax=Singulisphaera sp. PoT TaxID=3411797 RepID=UPI003BF5CF85